MPQATKQFMLMHKMTAEMEKGAPPDPEIMAGVGKMMEDAGRDGIMVSGEGLKPSSQRTRIAYKNGKRTITDGPFTEAKELVAGFVLMKVQSKQEALSWCDKFAAVIGDVELFLGPVVEPWDLGFGPKPKDAPLRYLSMHKMNERAENETPPDPTEMQKMGVLIAEMTSAGVLQTTGGLASTKKGARVRFSGGNHTVIDGPFTESKEVVAGYAILKLPSKQAAIEWAIRFGRIVKVNEVEVRQLAEW